MKRFIIGPIAVAMLAVFFCGGVFAQPGMMPGQPGMMPGGSGPGGFRAPSQVPVNQDQAESLLKDYLQAAGNPNLKPGEVTDKGAYFEGEVLSSKGEFVERIQIDKRTGRIYGRFHAGPGMRGYSPGAGTDSRGWNYCPYCGQRFPGRGQYGRGMMPHGYGPHMMGPGYGYPGRPGTTGPLDEAAAKKIVEGYLSSLLNPNLKIGQIRDKDAVYEVEIVTQKKEDLVDVIAVDKQSGYFRSIY